MAITETLGIDFVGSSAGLQDAVLASQRALAALNRDSSRMSFTLGRIMRTIVTPIAGVILSAFAAKKALADFTNSTLPGVNKYQQAMGMMQLSMFRLSSAVGELLAPAAGRVADIITAIATRLEPLIRALTANMPGIAAFFKQLGANALGPLRLLMPTVFGIIDGIVARFKGTNWASVLDNLVVFWQQAWMEILKFTAPILVRITTLIDETVTVIRDGLGMAWQFILDQAQKYGITVPKALSSVKSLASGIQLAIVTTLAALEVAVRNIPLLFDLLVASGGIAITFLMDNWREFGRFLVDYTKEVFAVIGQNISEIISKSFFTAIENGKNAAIKSGIFMANPSAYDPNTFKGRAGRFMMDTAFPSNMMPQFELKGLPSGPNFEIIKPSSTSLKALNDILDKIKDTFGSGIAARVKNAFTDGQQLVASLTNMMPGFWNGKAPLVRADQFAPIAPLLFGSRDAAMRESNQANKNPLVPLAQQANVLSQQQLVQQEAANKALARKARIANF